MVSSSQPMMCLHPHTGHSFRPMDSGLQCACVLHSCPCSHAAHSSQSRPHIYPVPSHSCWSTMCMFTFTWLRAPGSPDNSARGVVTRLTLAHSALGSCSGGESLENGPGWSTGKEREVDLTEFVLTSMGSLSLHSIILPWLPSIPSFPSKVQEMEGSLHAFCWPLHSPTTSPTNCRKQRGGRQTRPISKGCWRPETWLKQLSSLPKLAPSSAV